MASQTVSLLIMISLLQAAKYYKELPHQKEAWDYLTSLLTATELEKFAKLYRSAPVAEWLIPINLISQRDVKGDLNRDGRPDWYQTCNVTSVAMVVNFYKGLKVTPTDIDKLIVRRQGSRYSHANLAWALSHYSITSKFSTSTLTSNIIESIKSGNPVIWSNKLTSGGHIAVLSGWNETKQAFRIHDPYGEPTMVNGKWQYKDIRKPYWLSLASFNNSGMNGTNASGHWAHLLNN